MSIVSGIVAAQNAYYNETASELSVVLIPDKDFLWLLDELIVKSSYRSDHDRLINDIELDGVIVMPLSRLRPTR